MKDKNYSDNVFINCPFDPQYAELRNAMIFAIFDCGFIPRCALEENNGGNVRFDKIKRLIAQSKFYRHSIRMPVPSHHHRPVSIRSSP